MFPQKNIPLEHPGIPQLPEKRLTQSLFHGITVSRSDQAAPTVDHRLHSFEIFFFSKFIHSYNHRRHGTDQHLHSLCFRTSVQNIRAHSQIILGNPLIAACKFTALIYYTYCNTGNIPQPLLICRMISRRRVVFPHLGGETIRVCMICSLVWI